MTVVTMTVIAIVMFGAVAGFIYWSGKAKSATHEPGDRRHNP